MAQLHRLEADDTRVGGVLVVFPSGCKKTATWVHAAPVQDTVGAAKDITAKLLDELMREGLADDADRTNWPSMVAAISKHIKDWSVKRRAALYAEVPNIPPNT